MQIISLETICLKCKSLFSEKSKKIKMLSAENFTQHA